MKLELIKSNEKGKTYQADGFKIFYRFKNTISGDNSANLNEQIYLISGEALVTVNSNKITIEAPTTIEIPAKTYHKIEAQTDIVFILYES